MRIELLILIPSLPLLYALLDDGNKSFVAHPPFRWCGFDVVIQSRRRHEEDDSRVESWRLVVILRCRADMLELFSLVVSIRQSNSCSCHVLGAFHVFHDTCGVSVVKVGLCMATIVAPCF